MNHSDLAFPGGVGGEDIIGEIRKQYPKTPVLAQVRQFLGASDDFNKISPFFLKVFTTKCVL
jgi:hypothetical protein